MPHAAENKTSSGDRQQHQISARALPAPLQVPAERRNHAVLTTAALIAPGLILATTPWRGFGDLLFVGTIPALVGLMHGRRFALAAPALTAVLVAVMVAAGTTPLAAGIVMALVGLGVGASSLRGWQTLAVVMTSWPSVLLVAPPAALSTSGWLSERAVLIVLAGAATLLGGAWTLAVTAVLVPKPPSGEFTPQAPSTSIVYGASLAVLLGGIAYASTMWAPGSMAGWILLTVLVIARPGFTETRNRLLARVLGTVIGGALAALVGSLIPVPNATTLLGLLCLAAAVLFQLKKSSYTLYSVALTTSIVLLNSAGSGLINVDFQRVLFTLLGAAVAGLLVVALQAVLVPATVRTLAAVSMITRKAPAESAEARRQRQSNLGLLTVMVVGGCGLAFAATVIVHGS